MSLIYDKLYSLKDKYADIFRNLSQDFDELAVARDKLVDIMSSDDHRGITAEYAESSRGANVVYDRIVKEESAVEVELNLMRMELERMNRLIPLLTAHISKGGLEFDEMEPDD